MTKQQAIEQLKTMANRAYGNDFRALVRAILLLEAQ